MEGKKKIVTSSSSFTSELFGVFDSIFANSSKVMGRNSFNSETVRPRQYANEDWNKKNGNGTPKIANGGNEDNNSFSFSPLNRSDEFLRNTETGNQTIPRDASSFNQESRVQNPCNLSSSILYGGRDVYSRPPNSQNSAARSTVSDKFKNDGGEDDTDTASRGNWWQGSLYY